MQVAILDSANLAIVATDERGVIWTFNSTAERWLGYRVEEIIGRTTLGQLLDPAEWGARAREFEPRLGRSIETILDWVLAVIHGTADTHDEREWTLIRKDGSRFPVALSLNVLRDAAGEPTGTLGVARDITVEKAAEVERSRAREAAEQASRTKSQFLAHMSHEVRTPLHGIIGVTAILLETPLDATQRSLAETVHTSAQALQAVVGRVLDFSKIEAGRMILEAADFSPAALLREVVQLHAVRAGAKGVGIAWHVAPEVPEYVSGDGDRLRQIVHNLVGNAVKFSSRGTVHVRVESMAADEHGHPVATGRVGLRFSVQDEGIGIPLDAQGLIFEPFAQADESTSRRFGGTGLGLAIARQLVELMGGEISVQSDPGAGATFWFTAVFGAALVRPPASSLLPSVEVPAWPGTALRQMQILLVEDSDTNRLVAQHQLIEMGCALSAVASGRAAIEAACHDHFHLILMDCQMPEMDGYAATAEIRRHEAETGWRSRIVALTARAEEGEREHCLAAGMDEYLAKPFLPAQLATIVRAVAAGLARPTPDAAPVGAAALTELRDAPPSADEPLLARLVHIYEREAPETLRTLAAGTDHGDNATLEIAAHKLKGASGNFGATRLQQLCQLVEDLCHQDQARFISWLLPEIESEVGAVLEALRRTI